MADCPRTQIIKLRAQRSDLIASMKALTQHPPSPARDEVMRMLKRNRTALQAQIDKIATITINLSPAA